MRFAAFVAAAAVAAATPASAQLRDQVPIQVALTGSVAKLSFGATSPTPVRGAEAYVHAADASDPNAWIGPSITVAQGRFSFLNVPRGTYLLRVYSGPFRLWEQVVVLPTQLAPIVFDDVDIVYYAKAVDGTTVDAALQRVRLPYNKVTSTSTVPTNAIWFGDRVPVKDAKLVARALVDGGVRLQTIQRFASGADWRAVVVEVGSSPQHASDPPLTGAAVDTAQDFPRSR